jgi:hypothetical protein
MTLFSARQGTGLDGQLIEIKGLDSQLFDVEGHDSHPVFLYLGSENMMINFEMRG